MSSRPTDVRASGLTQADEVTAEVAKEAEESERPEDPGESLDPARSIFRGPGFSRMKFSWSGPDGEVVARARAAVTERINENFLDAHTIMHDLFMVVRQPERDPNTGQQLLDGDGWPVWKRTPSGGYEEDWTALSRKQRENFLFEITTRLFRWEMLSTDAWGEAMFAKAIWEESFSIGYDAPVTGTIEDRTAKGRMRAAEDRYFAIFLTLYSKKAEAITRSMSILGQRLKDTLEV